MGGNGPSIEVELSHGRFVACHKINFHIKHEKRELTYTRVLHFFFNLGRKLGGSTDTCRRLVREYIR